MKEPKNVSSGQKILNFRDTQYSKKLFEESKTAIWTLKSFSSCIQLVHERKRPKHWSQKNLFPKLFQDFFPILLFWKQCWISIYSLIFTSVKDEERRNCENSLESQTIQDLFHLLIFRYWTVGSCNNDSATATKVNFDISKVNKPDLGCTFFKKSTFELIAGFSTLPVVFIGVFGKYMREKNLYLRVLFQSCFLQNPTTFQLGKGIQKEGF